MPTRYRLNALCPVRGCSGPNSSSGWVCAKDRDTMYIDEDGYLSCETRAHRDKIINWRFDCGQRGSGSKHNYERYQEPDMEAFTHALAMGMTHLGEAGAVWLCKLITNIETQFKNR